MYREWVGKDKPKESERRELVESTAIVAKYTCQITVWLNYSNNKSKRFISSHTKSYGSLANDLLPVTILCGIYGLWHWQEKKEMKEGQQFFAALFWTTWARDFRWAQPNCKGGWEAQRIPGTLIESVLSGK